MFFKIPVVWKEAGIMVIEADSLEEAERIARDKPELPDRDYLSDSFELDKGHPEYGVIENSPLIYKPNIPLEKLDFSVRAYNCLKRWGINTLEDLKGYSISELRKIRNLNQKSVDEIQQKLAAYGITLQ